jgi:hypothetical protein
MLDNPMCSATLAHRHEERNSRVEIVPNPFGGVNTPFWKRDLHRRYCPLLGAFLYSPRQARRPEDPEAVWRCQRKEQDQVVFSEESSSVLALGLLHLTI